MWGVEELAAGLAVIVVKRGPNAGTWFLLGQPVTSVGRNPDSDTYLDFAPWRRNVGFLPVDETPIRPLIDDLHFIEDKKRWATNSASACSESTITTSPSSGRP